MYRLLKRKASMPSWREIREAGLREMPASLYESPWHLMAILVLSIILAEAATMALIYFYLPLPQTLWRLDPGLAAFVLIPATLTLFLFPSLVYFVLLPLRRNIAERKKTEAELQSSREQLRLLSSHLQSALEEERTGIAREIHDELGQVLASLALDISLLEDELPLRQVKLRRKTGAMARHIDSAIKTVQRVSAELRPVMLDDLGIAAAVQWQVQEFEKRTGIPCNLRIELADKEPDRDRSTALFRILQETLTNILRHAQATRVSVRLQETAGVFVLQVGDNGRGINRNELAATSSLGLLGIRERVGRWGGSVAIRGLPQRGTTVKVTIPDTPAPKSDRRKGVDIAGATPWISPNSATLLHRKAS